MPPVTIRRLSEITEPQRLIPAIDQIFFDASSVTSFANDAERAEFRDRWLGRFLRHDFEWVYVAGSDFEDLRKSHVVGYLVASLDDPARSERFADIAYFQDFADVTPLYPAQLHINLQVGVRGDGVGSMVLQRALEDMSAAGVPGVHVVTGRGMRNVGFYVRNGFDCVAQAKNSGKDIVLLGRKLKH